MVRHQVNFNFGLIKIKKPVIENIFPSQGLSWDTLRS